MTERTWFAPDDIGEDFEESVRVDRETGAADDHRRQTLQTYHVTDDAQRFLDDFLARLLGRSDDMRTGSNYWLYGYYGSGKSHLLSVLDGLMDSSWIEGQRDGVWNELAGDQTDLVPVREQWSDAHDDYHVIPVSVNLLKYQGQKERSFSEIVLRTVHQSPAFTGTTNGFSPRLDVAYFEDWYRTTGMWNEREERAQAVLDGVVDEPRQYDWEDIQRYGALADVVLPPLFEQVTGTRDGFSDLQPSDIDPEAMVSRLEELRAARDEETEKPVKLVLLLDEVSLFIGTDFERLTELNALAENIDEIGDGNIQLVVTAQEKIEDVQPRFAARGADFSIVKDRFPHRYSLPSRHVGEIVQQRLLTKTSAGATEVEDILDEASVRPADSFVYNEIGQNTEPPLDAIDDDQLIEFYPFLPYQPVLFLEILSNLRREAADPAKSIFSGTARAILALVHGLLQEWLTDGTRDHLISLIDFYDLIEPELEDIVGQDIEVVEEIKASEQDGDLEAIDVRVAKTVLLLQHVDDTVRLTEDNIAVAVMKDLGGRNWTQTKNDVNESLERLTKYIRPTDDESGPLLRFADQDEREIYETADENERDPDWDAIVAELDEYLWDEIVRELPLPESIPYDDSAEEYPLRYRFRIDGYDLTTSTTAESGLETTVEIRGFVPDASDEGMDEETLYWHIGSNGLDNLRQRLEAWWALRDAVGEHQLPPSVEQDLTDRATKVRRGLVEALQSGTYEVRDRSDIRGLPNAVSEYVDVRYPDDFHPVMLQVGEEHLQELRDLTAVDTLPAWSETIQVATEDPETHGGTIQNNVRAHTGQQLRGSDGSLSLATILDGIVDEEPIYDEARPALCAIIWGLCRKGDFLPVDESGRSLELDSVLDLDRQATTRLRIAPRGANLRTLLHEGGFRDTTETVADGLVNLQAANDQLAQQFESLREDVHLIAESDARSQAITGVLSSFEAELASRREAARDRREAIKSRETEWEETITETSAAAEWRDIVRDLWSRRLAVVLQIDALLTLSQQSFPWIGDNCIAAADVLSDAIEDYDGAWWTPEGWNEFANIVGTEPSLEDELSQDWATYRSTSGIETLADEIEAHPWIVPATELPTGVRPAFERKFIIPLRQTRKWFEDLDEVFAATFSDPTTTDADTYVRALDEIADTRPLRNLTGTDIDESRRRLEMMDTIVGERSPSDVEMVGLLPVDRDSLDSELNRLAKEHELGLEESTNGVIIR